MNTIKPRDISVVGSHPKLGGQQNIPVTWNSSVENIPLQARVYYAQSIQAQAKSKQARTENLDATGTPGREEDNTILTPWAMGRNHSTVRR